MLSLSKANPHMSKPLFQALLDAVKSIYDATPDLQNFGNWPQEMTYCDIAPNPVPAIRQIKKWQNAAPAHVALQNVIDKCNWKQTYTEEEVGYGFLQDYGYIELFGPDGHFRTNDLRGYIAYWGRGLYYPWHNHQAQEIYCVISGSGVFEAEDTPTRICTVGDCQYHAAYQPHALTLKDGPILALVLWRGDGLQALPQMHKP